MLVDRGLVAEVERSFGTELTFVRRLLAVGRDAIRAGHAIATRGDESHRLALGFLSRATSALHAVETLFSIGLETDATSVMRTIAELVIDFEWIWSKDRTARIRLFAEYINVTNQKRLASRLGQGLNDADRQTLQKMIAETKSFLPSGVDTPEKYLEWCKAEYERVRGQYDERKSWAGVTIARRARECDLKDLYELQFTLGSEATHSGAATLTGQYLVNGGAVQVADGPSMPTSPFVLVLVAQAYGQLLERVVGYLELPGINVQSLINEFLAAFPAGKNAV
jgi:hypothetical protein